MKNSSSSLALGFFFLILFNNSYAANSEQNAVNQQDWITRGQQNKLEEGERIREQRSIKKDRERKKKSKQQDKNRQLKSSQNSTECFKIQKIKLTNAKSFSQKKQQKLTEVFLGQCLKGSVLSQIVSKINSAYHKAGYVTARVSVPKQNIKSGVLELNILEGRIGEIILGDNNLSDRMQKFTAFGMIEGDVLNIKDLNQGIYQINRLPSSSATLKIEPSLIEDEAVVYIDNNRSFPAHATISHDNLGNNFTGVKRTNFSSGFDNIFSLNDNINLNYSTNLNDDSNKKEIKSFSGSFSIPFHYNSFSIDYSRSVFRGSNQLENDFIKVTGYSDRSTINWNRLLFNDGDSRISGYLSLTEKRSASYFNDSKIENSERNLTIGKIAFSVSSYFKNNVSIYLKPSYSRGLKLLDAKQDQKNLPSSNPKAQFELFQFYGNISKKLLLPKVNIPLVLTSELSSQFAKETLFGSEQFAVGGYYSVRGFRENYITGDSGYYFRNKANINLGSVIAPFLGWKNKQLNKVTLEPFYDYGYVKNKYSGTDGRLSGAGINTLFNSKNFSASLTYSWGMGQSQLITSNKKENKLVYFELTAKCC